ncbi:MAG: hypothetical protein JSW05_01150 [Candidatus Thorarchaeota archaeon]|nr:MAG: hypothetical protein JSW05_01150 [Candidatus Thorarchaeota archaeon]
MTPVPFASVYGLTSLLIPIPFVFNLVFGHTVLLYLQSRASKMRTALYGILGVVVPYSMLSFPYLMTGEVTGFIPTFIPLPVLQAVGVLMMVFVDSTLQDERIWDDVDERMWFDEGGRDEERTPDTTPEVTIPVTYLLKSRIRNLWNGSNSRTVTTDPKKAEWAHDEEVWT